MTKHPLIKNGECTKQILNLIHTKDVWGPMPTSHIDVLTTS